jgi:hypothetical protein
MQTFNFHIFFARQGLWSASLSILEAGRNICLVKMFLHFQGIKIQIIVWQKQDELWGNAKTNNALIIVETMINLDISAMVCINSADICDLWQFTYFAYFCQNWICFCSISPSTDGV